MTRGLGKRSHGDADLVTAWIVSLALAFLLGAVRAPTEKFVWDTKINPLQVVTLLVTVSVSLAFFRTIERQKYRDKLRKDALIDALKGIAEKLRDLEKATESDSPDFLAVVAAFRALGREVDSYSGLARALEMSVGDSENVVVRQTLRGLNRLLTYTPSDSEQQKPDDLSVERGKLQIPGTRRRAIASSMDELRHTSLRLRAAIIMTA